MTNEQIIQFNGIIAGLESTEIILRAQFKIIEANMLHDDIELLYEFQSDLIIYELSKENL